MLRRTQLRRKTPMRRMSAKRRRQIPLRRACIEAVRERSGGRCEVGAICCTGGHDHTHEIKPRSAGGSITDPANCLAVCFPCHEAIHSRPNVARKAGWLV